MGNDNNNLREKVLFVYILNLFRKKEKKKRKPEKEPTNEATEKLLHVVLLHPLRKIYTITPTDDYSPSVNSSIFKNFYFITNYFM